MDGCWFVGLIECLGRRDLLDQNGARDKVAGRQVNLGQFEHGGSNGFLPPEAVIGLEAGDKGLIINDTNNLLGPKANASAVGSGAGREGA